MTLDADLKALATGKNFAALTTLAADGQPRTHIMWIDSDEDHLVFNTEVHRAKFRDLERDPRVTITVFNVDNPYQFVEARGTATATITGPDAKAHIDSLASKYMGVDTYPGEIESERVIVQMTPTKVHKNGY
ncbi:MAG TPA: PPOX class F420-dependent oxidoreductase [Ilumatobacter sp.]|nr:PPOX class F420-dependent oxidoreductase [Ilumatobacter sp.]